MPTLLLPALEQRIRSRQLPSLMLFVGEDVRLMEQLVDAVEGTVAEGDRPFAVERVYAAEPGGFPVDIAAAARVYPMLGDRRIVIVLRAERLLKPKRAGKPAESDDDGGGDEEDESIGDLGALEDYVAAPAPFSTLLFVASSLDRGRRFTKKLVQEAQITEFGGIGGDDPMARQGAFRVAAEWMQAELEKAGRTIDSQSLRMLVDRSAGDISKLRGDVERLVLYTEGRSRVTREDVVEVSSEAFGSDPWAVVNAIGDGDPARALRMLAIRLEHGDSPHAIVGQLRWWVSTKLGEGAPDRVKPAIDALLRTDIALKSSAGSETVLLERLVVELTGKRVERQWR